MKLSKEQIDHLYQFTRQHYVEYYDLQTELVDHLANAIEEQWQENPKLSFEEALQKEFKKFGVFGFMDVVEQRQKALNKKYNQMVWQYLKTFLTVPKIVGTLSSIGILYYFLNYFQSAKEIISLMMIVMLVLFISGLFVLTQKRKREALQTGKKWLLNEIIFGYNSIASMSYIVFHFVPGFEGTIHNELVILFYSISIILLLLLEYIILILIPSKAEEYLEQTYPEYKFQKD